jgi:hypothetical protein
MHKSPPIPDFPLFCSEVSAWWHSLLPNDATSAILRTGGETGFRDIMLLLYWWGCQTLDGDWRVLVCSATQVLERLVGARGHALSSSSS